MAWDGVPLMEHSPADQHYQLSTRTSQIAVQISQKLDTQWFQGICFVTSTCTCNCAKRLFPSGCLGIQMFVLLRPEKGDFCEGYKRLGQGHIRLGKNRKSCAEKTWFLRRVQASRNGSDPPRQFFRSQIRVLKKNFTNWDRTFGFQGTRKGISASRN